MDNELKELKELVYSLKNEIELTRTYHQTRELLADWIYATKNRVNSYQGERYHDAISAVNTWEHLDKCYFDIPHRAGRVQIMIDAAQECIKKMEKHYGKTTKLKRRPTF